MKVAALQMVSSTRPADNLARARALLADAALQGAELAVLPEYFCLLGRHDTDKLAVQEAFGAGPLQSFLADVARELRMWIVGGTLPLSTSIPASPGARVFNSSLVFAPDGRCIARYDKMHLFRFDSGSEQFDETRVLQPGDRPVLFELPSRDGYVWRIGMSVCYDLRFPELYRHYAGQGADVLLVPSAFTHTTGQAHWELLLRARAVENLAWVVAPAQGGLHENGRRTWGHSMIVDPWGQVHGPCPQGEAVLTADLDAQRVAQCRAQLPALAHRRL
jgi:predicted amidohydrolase